MGQRNASREAQLEAPSAVAAAAPGHISSTACEPTMPWPPERPLPRRLDRVQAPRARQSHERGWYGGVMLVLRAARRSNHTAGGTGRLGMM
jgi:hypothetical protein